MATHIEKADLPFDKQLNTFCLTAPGAPVLKVTLAQGGHPLLHAQIKGYEAFQIWRDSSDGNGYQQVGTSLHPDFLDLSALPAAGVAIEERSLRKIFLGRGKG